MKRVIKVVGLLSCLLVSSVQAGESEHQALAESFLNYMDVERLLNQNIDNLVESEMYANPQYGLFETTLREYFQTYMGWEKNKQDFISAVTVEYTESELEVIVAFYATAPGQKVLKSFPVVLQSGLEAGQKKVTEHIKILQESIKSEAAKIREQKKTSS